jgi:hypothetical protein
MKIPDGYILVPIIPTRAMEKAGAEAIKNTKTYVTAIRGNIGTSYVTQRATPRHKAEAAYNAMIQVVKSQVTGSTP